MGFFQDLKDDLSQAVNEMIPEEGEAIANQQGLLLEEDHDDDLAEIEAMFRQKDEPEELIGAQDEAIANLLDEPIIEDTAMEKPSVEEAVIEAEKVPVRESREGKLDMNVNVNQSAHKDEISTITAGMTINGDITSQGSLELIGCVRGNINVSGKMSITGIIEGNSQASEVYAESAKITGEVRSIGTVKVGQETVIIGNIFASSAVIAGAVKGDIDVQGPVVLDTSAIVMGNIKSKSVQINNGAVVEGMCSQCYADINPASFFEEINKTGRI